MIFIRSLVVNVAFYLVLGALIVFGCPVLIFGRRGVLGLARAWGRSSLWLLRVICGLDVEFRGLGNIPTGGFILAPKHQSVWETFALLLFVPDFTYILKRELTWIPFFGWYLLRGEQIAIDRARGSSALAQATRRSCEALENGRQVLIFPEGTRRPVGAPPLYKYGVAAIYAESRVLCVPVALNSGLFWQRRSFIRRPGKVLVEFLEPIQPGLDKHAFLKLLSVRLEGATDRLIAESVAQDPSLNEVLAAGRSAA